VDGGGGDFTQLDRMDTMSVEQELAELKGTINEFRANTKIYRACLDTKITKIFDKIDGLPCDLRSGRYDIVQRQIDIHWRLILVVLGAIGGAWLKLLMG